jgi:hypothetical protein
VTSDSSGSPEAPSDRPEKPSGDTWTPRVEGEEGDPTAFDFVFGGAIAVVVVVAILWAFGFVTF